MAHLRYNYKNPIIDNHFDDPHLWPWVIPFVAALFTTATGAAVSSSIASSQQKSATEKALEQQQQQENQAYQSATKDGVLNYALARMDVTAPEYQSLFEYAIPSDKTSQQVLDYAKTKITEYETRIALTPAQIAANEEAVKAQYDSLLAALTPEAQAAPIITVEPAPVTTSAWQNYLPLMIGGLVVVMIIMMRRR